jgi:hypothetical protein
MEYSDLGRKTYGEKCEFDSCGWDTAACDVHHIGYQEQQDFEKRIRAAYKAKDTNTFTTLKSKARSAGYLDYDAFAGQLEKDNRSHNLSVLCPNHHRYVHHVDMGMEILNHIPTRK